MAKKKQIIGGPLEIGGRILSLSRAIRAGDFVYLTGQIPMQNGAPMTTGKRNWSDVFTASRRIALRSDQAGKTVGAEKSAQLINVGSKHRLQPFRIR